MGVSWFHTRVLNNINSNNNNLNPRIRNTVAGQINQNISMSYCL